jgi:hypothetical protein
MEEGIVNRSCEKIVSNYLLTSISEVEVVVHGNSSA